MKTWTINKVLNGEKYTVYWKRFMILEAASNIRSTNKWVKKYFYFGTVD
jgi:hypothetical protein